MARIIRGYWDCQYCGKKSIDGLVDTCPGCGRRKPKNTKYYMRSGPIPTNDVLTDEELKDAGISREECDGNHKDWVCDFCNSLNNWSDTTCRSCGSPKKEATKEYGQKELYENYASNVEVEPIRTKTYIPYIIGALLILLSVILLFPYNKTISVTGFAWERNVALEEYKTVEESDWEVPSGGRVYDEQSEIRSYQDVFDHYETRSVEKSREVFDHYDTYTSYSDNGNGTFTEHTSQSPVYRTEYYTETYEEPVYRKEPIYDTKYYYEIERWVHTDNYRSSGNDKNPYWNEEYLPLKENMRDTDKTEKYEVFYDNGTDEIKSYSDWNQMSVGDKLVQKRCLLGIVYSTY